ncbi:MAG: uracil-DNA glycosylase [Pseudomonadota bacterium]
MVSERQVALAALDIIEWQWQPPEASCAALLPPEPAAAPLAADDRAGVEDLSWDALRARVATCTACELCHTRTQTVFGVGDPHARLMIVGEAPGAEEDRLGEPFVGPAGKLLDEMLFAIGLRREQVYICNILKCRPPRNADPTLEQSSACRPFLARQIALVNPAVILAVGRIAAQNLLQSTTPIGRLRGESHSFTLDPHRIAPVWVTYHPAYLLRSPAEKSRVWEDLKKVRRALDAIPS